MASASSHRQIVLALIEATIPRRTASLARSAQLKRENGRLDSLGSSQASALTSTTSAGGKSSRPARAREAFQARQTLAVEPLAPLADDLPRQVKAAGNLGVLQTRGGQQHDFGADNVAKWRCVLSCNSLQYLPLLIRENNGKWAHTWHRRLLSHTPHYPSNTKNASHNTSPYFSE
jgi:hypothetical protein